MPDEVVRRGLPSRLDSAVVAIESWLSTLPGMVRRLAARELSAYRTRRFTIGWRLTVAFPDGSRDLDLLLNDRFPRDEPRVGLPSRPQALAFPHVDGDGLLCVLSALSGTDPFSPVLVVRNVLSSAITLFEDLIAGNHSNDFQQEFLSYWTLACDGRQLPVHSLVTLGRPTRAIRVWRGSKRCVVGDDETTVLNWVTNLLDVKKTDQKTESGVFLWLDHPLVPSEYPESVADILALARQTGGEKLISDLLEEETNEIIVVLGAETSHGPCLAGISLVPSSQQRWPGERPTSQIHRGFRNEKIPKQLLQSRLKKNVSLTKSVVDRVDAAWIHGRGLDARLPRLQGASIAVLGCGSIGAPVAVLLAKSGVGRLILVDPELLTWANVGRHVLGAGSVDRYKVKALAERLRRDFPHIREVHGFHERWEDLMVSNPGAIESCDIIVSAMGNWSAEGALNEWHIREGRRLPIIYGWTEPEAVAGHAVAVVANGGCFQCGVDQFGTPLLKVAEWSTSPAKQEPACGAFFQPYGPIDVANVVNLVAELTMDSLLGHISTSTHRVWVSRPERLAEVGGWFREEWIQAIGASRPYAFVEERPWPKSHSCRECMQSHSSTESELRISG